jgi:hypothetical protein
VGTPEQDPVILEKRAKGWVLPEYFDAPVSDGRVEALLDQLQGLRKRQPLSTSEAATERFKVAADSFERLIELYGEGEGTMASLYLGESPGFRRVYARAANDDTVYEVSYGVHQVSPKPVDWADRGLLRLSHEELSRIELSGVTLERVEGTWRVADLGEGEQSNEEEIRAALAHLGAIGFLSIEDVEPPAGQPVLELKVARKDGESWSYRFYRGEGDAEPLLRSSARPWTFRVAEFLLEELQQLNREKLVKAASQPAPTEQAPAGEAAGPEGAADPGKAAGDPSEETSADRAARDEPAAPER